MATFSVQFLTDLTLVTAIAAAATLIFHRLRQPVVLGFLLAGILVGPHSPGPSVSSLDSVQALAELGVIFLMFSIGMEFRLSRLARAGVPAIGAAVIQILAVLGLTLLVGRLFGWSTTDALFLGAILAISSTVLAARAIVESGRANERWAELALAILIVEDVVAVTILAVLSAGGQQPVGVLDVLGVLGRLGMFALVILVLGLLTLPRLVNRLAREHASEVLVITLAGIALTTALLAIFLGFSPALGAFLVGAVVAEASQVHQAEERVSGLRDLFSAVFFVSVGMLLEPALILEHWRPIAVLAVLLVVFRVALYSAPAMLLGARPRDAFRMSMAMSHIGEFSFVIAALGLTLGVLSDFVLPVTIAIAALSAFWTPFMVRESDATFEALRARVPGPVARAWEARARRRARRRETRGGPWARSETRRALARAAANAVTAALILSTAGGLGRALAQEVTVEGLSDQALVLIPWLAGGLLALPFAIRSADWFRQLHTALAPRAPPSPGEAREEARGWATSRLVGAGVAVAAALLLLVGLLASSPSLPPTNLLVAALGIYAVVAFLLWGRITRAHARIEEALADAFEGQPQGEDRLAVLDALVHEYRPGLEVERVRLRGGTLAAEGTIRDLALRTRTGATVMAVQRRDLTVNPRPDFELGPGDVLVLLGTPEAIASARGVLQERIPPAEVGEQPRVAEVPVEQDAPVAGATLAESGLGERAGVMVVGVLRGRQRIFNPPPATRLQAGDMLVLVGLPEDLTRARNLTRGPEAPR